MKTDGPRNRAHKRPDNGPCKKAVKTPDRTQPKAACSTSTAAAVCSIFSGSATRGHSPSLEPPPQKWDAIRKSM
jgi:hypothetical protein